MMRLSEAERQVRKELKDIHKAAYSTGHIQLEVGKAVKQAKAHTQKSKWNIIEGLATLRDGVLEKISE